MNYALDTQLGNYILYRAINFDHLQLGRRRPGLVCTYAITNKKSGKVYFGSSANFFSRWDNHLRNLRKGRHKCADLQKAYNEDGEENFSIAIVRSYATTENLLLLEESDCRARYADDNLYNRRLGSTWIRGYTGLNSKGSGSGYKPKKKVGKQSQLRWFDFTGKRWAA